MPGWTPRAWCRRRGRATQPGQPIPRVCAWWTSVGARSPVGTGRRLRLADYRSHTFRTRCRSPCFSSTPREGGRSGVDQWRCRARDPLTEWFRVGAGGAGSGRSPLRPGDPAAPPSASCATSSASRGSPCAAPWPLLAEDRQIYSVRGRGTFVVGRSPRGAAEHPASPSATSSGATGSHVGASVLRSDVLPATWEQAEEFGIAPGASLFFLSRLRTLDELPVAIDDTLLPLSLGPGVPALDWSEASLYETLRAAGHTPHHAEYTVGARGASVAEVGPLRVEVGFAVLLGIEPHPRRRRTASRLRTHHLPGRPVPVPQHAGGRDGAARTDSGPRGHPGTAPLHWAEEPATGVICLTQGLGSGSADERGPMFDSPPSPPPRPTYAEPTVLRFRQDTAHHVWGDTGPASSRTGSTRPRCPSTCWSSSCPAGAAFTHSESNKTVFAGDVAYCVLDGELVLVNPRVGEVRRVRAGQGVLFRRDTWHHGFNPTGATTRVLEFFSPPPEPRHGLRVRQAAAEPGGGHLRRPPLGRPVARRPPSSVSRRGVPPRPRRRACPVGLRRHGCDAPDGDLGLHRVPHRRPRDRLPRTRRGLPPLHRRDGGRLHGRRGLGRHPARGRDLLAGVPGTRDGAVLPAGTPWRGPRPGIPRRVLPPRGGAGAHRLGRPGDAPAAAGAPAVRP